MTEQAAQRLSAAEVRQVAALCHIALTDEEVERLREEMAKLLGEVRVLRSIDTAGVEPTGHAVADIHTVMRADEPRAPLDREDALANAPRREGDFFRVRAVMEDSDES